MPWLAHIMIGVAFAAMASASSAQIGGDDGATFVAKVRDRDNSAALALLGSKPALVDAHDSRGETALLVAVKRRDLQWTAHLLRAGANPDLAARNGDTPLIVAARSSFADGARQLLQAGAEVDGANKLRETPLIIAVQNRDLALVKLLLAKGADPDRTDAAAGYSARDYARRDTRSRELLAQIEASKRPAKPASDDIDDFKLD